MKTNPKWMHITNLRSLTKADIDAMTEPIVITHHGRDIAVLVPIDQYNALTKEKPDGSS